MKIVFLMRHAGYVRNFEWTLRLLAERGHRLHVAFDLSPRQWMLAPKGIVDSLADEYPSISHGPAPGRDSDGWNVLAKRLRLTIDYLRYLTPRYRDADKLRARAARRAPRLVRRVAQSPLARSPVGLTVLDRILRSLERAIPRSRPIAAFIRQQRPDIVLVTPLVELGAPQTDYVRAAKGLGVRTALAVASWDNLTNKGLIHDTPDLVTVWNRAMQREAVELHGVAAEHVVVTGAVPYDHWFQWRPSTSREEFCRRVGLPSDRPFVLYLCSSPFIAPHEASFVRKWLTRLRGRREPSLSEAGVLVRPHPVNAAQWGETDLSGLGEVVVWPRAGADPVDAESRADYYDSIYHCAAVVGVNTSALIESAIVGRPVHTLLAAEFRGTQGGTLHFRHLLGADGGLLHVAGTFGEHATQLESALARAGERDERGRRFLEGFVRPYGLGQAATPRLVAAIEAAAAAPRRPPAVRPAWAAPLQVLLTPLAWYEQRRQLWRAQRAARRALPRMLRRLLRRGRPVSSRLKQLVRRRKVLIRRARPLVRCGRGAVRRGRAVLRRGRGAVRRGRVVLGRGWGALRWGRAVRRPRRMVRARGRIVPRRGRRSVRRGTLLLKRVALRVFQWSLSRRSVHRFVSRRILRALEAVASRLEMRPPDPNASLRVGLAGAVRPEAAGRASRGDRSRRKTIAVPLSLERRGMGGLARRSFLPGVRFVTAKLAAELAKGDHPEPAGTMGFTRSEIGGVHGGNGEPQERGPGTLVSADRAPGGPR